MGSRSGPPTDGQLGVVDGVLVDRAFADDTDRSWRPARSIRLGPHNVANALAAAALARSYGVPAGAVADGLAGLSFPIRTATS